MTDAELAREPALQREDRIGGTVVSAARGAFGIDGARAWLGVGIAFLIGVWIEPSKVAALLGVRKSR